MSAVYVVIALDNGADLTACEVYAGAQAALGRAFALAHYSAIMNFDWVNPSPAEEKLPDGSIKWVFLDTSKKYIAVHYKNILLSNFSKKDPMEDLKMNLSVIADKKDDLASSQNVIDTSVIKAAPDDPVVMADAPYDDNLPGGWFTNNKPAKMIDLWDTPDQVKSVYDLTFDQKVALVAARIMNRPNYQLYIPGLGTFNQSSALLEIKKKSTAGDEIVEDECAWIEDVRQDRLDELDKLDEEDSSSYW